MALRRPPTTFSDQITDADIGADSIGTSELKNDAVETANIKDSTGASDGITSAKIATDAVIAAKIATGAVIADGIGAGAVVTAGLGASAVTKEKMAASAIEVKPHIIPGTLYPAVLGNKLDGTATANSTTGPAGSTVASGKYGTVQSDGRMYYYTDIKGSKPIKDPRIGAYFGSQRYTTTFLQLLEQETATHGSNIYSVDGREWMRVLSGDGFINYAANGHQLRFNSAGMFLEIVGYFNGSLIGTEVEGSGTRSMEVKVDGVVAHSSLNVATATLGSPLINRYVDSSSLRDIDLTSASSLSSDTTLGIHTLKLSANWSSGSHNISMMKIELIAQDTTSTANKSKIQIPTQNVVSYGKKFAIPTTAQHYDPFNGFTSGSSVTAYVDTTTSLGIEGWKNSSTYYRPYNGGRVVKWVDSSGTIKTSVNMMPPNAKSIKNADISKKANASVANNTYLPTFEAGTIDHSQAEVAKTFHWREFGNGAANGGAGSGNADASMLNADDDISYVMDDGLTSFSAKDPDKHANYDSWNLLASAENGFYTFIGTGFAIHQLSTATCTYTYDAWVDGVLVQNDVTFTGKGWKTLAQNLPYGSHIIKFNNTGTSGSEVATFNEVSFHQPKMPPIPEDACIIADYMLMADFVPHTTQGHEKISKGSRYISASRDFLHDAANGTLTFNVGRQNSAKGGLIVEYVNPGVNEVGPQLTWFGDAKMVNEAVQISDSTERSKHYFDGATTNVTVTSDYTDSGAITTGLPSSSEAHYCVYGTKTTGVMGKQISKFVAHPDDTSNDWLYYAGAQVSTPIHTSSHYQTFETPHLLELVGGDRNMEQTNLIVTSDGKSWDEVTRDTSYIGDMALQIHSTTTAVDNNVFVIMDECRGYGAGGKYVNYGNKDFAIAYDRQICLKDGEYEFFMGSIYQNQDSQQEGVFFVNGNKVHSIYTSTGSWGSALISGIIQLKRGDYVQIKGGYWQHNEPYYSQYYIKRLK